MRRTALALSLLVLVFPASALAQSAGDNQYQDPFANQSTSQGTGSQSNSTSSQTSTSTPSSSSTSSDPSSSTGTAGTGASGGTSNGSGSSQLPFTGYDSIFSGVLGAVLLLGGLTVRASVRDRRK